MPESLLHTKLFRPPIRPFLVPRPDLLARLNQGLQRGHRLTLVSAPAGFGKTTLVNVWTQALRDAAPPTAVAWLSLDDGDNDLIRFLSYVITALNQLAETPPIFGQNTLALLQSPQPPAIDVALTPLINELAAITHPIILAIDDYHLIEAPPVHDALDFLLHNSPPSLHVVIATREDPPLPLPRWRARNQLTELRALDLRFSRAEAADFLNRVMGLDLSAADVGALETRTEGWITGLQLAAISMQGSQDSAGFIHSFAGSHRFVLDYLIEEVLEQQPDAVQSFLLQTAVLTRLTGSLCDALTGQTNGQNTLEMLDKANLFIVPLDDERRWYRYHHLFADLLNTRLQQTLPARPPILHRQASDWFQQQGLFKEALKHSLAAADYQQAAELVKAIAIDTMEAGAHTTVIRWINELPEQLVQSQPYLCVLHGWALQLAGKLDAAEARLVAAEKAMAERQFPGPDDDTILGLIHSHRAYITFMTGEHDRAIAYAHQALAQLPQNAVLIRVQTALYLGVAYRYQGQFEAALAIYKENLAAAQQIGGRLAVLAYLHLGDLHRQTAHLHRAYAFYEEALRFTEQQTGKPDMPYTGYAYVCLGRILREWNQLEAAQALTTKGLDLCRAWNVADILALSCIEWAYLQQALGNETQAQAAMAEAVQIMEDFSAWGRTFVAAYRVELDLRRNDISAAVRWAATGAPAVDGVFEFHREGEYLALARVGIAQERFEEVYSLVARIQAKAQESGKKRTELEALILLALIHAGRGETQKALSHLKMAFAIAEPEGFLRTFLDEGEPLIRLLHVAQQRGIMPEYVRRLLAGASPTNAVNLTPASGYSQPRTTQDEDQSHLRAPLIEPLSARELEVLQHIAAGLTNREIAERLYLSLNTVKAHTRSIYGKLDVHNRTKAVTKGRELNILARE